MEIITSRKNKIIAHMRALGADREYRRECGEYLCDGEKLLNEARLHGAGVGCVLWGRSPAACLPESIPQYSVPPELLEYVSPLSNSPGPVFTVRIPEAETECAARRAIVLENVQDPGNVGTVIRTANAFNMDAVILAGACADMYNPKTVRAASGALFRQLVIETDLNGLEDFLKSRDMKLFGAALSADAKNIRDVRPGNAAFALGSEGRGLSAALLGMCEGEVTIPMNPACESLNVAVAAAIIMWESVRQI